MKVKVDDPVSKESIAKSQRNNIIFCTVSLFMLWLFPIVTTGWQVFIAVSLYATFTLGLLIVIGMMKDLEGVCLRMAIEPGTTIFNFDRWNTWIDLHKNRRTFLYYLHILARLSVIAYASATSSVFFALTGMGILSLAIGSTIQEKIVKFVSNKDNRTKYGAASFIHNIREVVSKYTKDDE